MSAAQLTDIQKQAAMFLQEVAERAEHYGERLDPKNRRDYERDPVLRGIDAVRAAAKRVLAIPEIAAILPTGHLP